MDVTLIVETLRATPALLRPLKAHLSSARAWPPPEPGKWSSGEMVRHLAAGDRDTFFPYLHWMVAEARPVVECTPAERGGCDDLLLERLFQLSCGLDSLSELRPEVQGGHSVGERMGEQE